MQLHGVHDIRELAVDLVWSPADSAGAGYEFLSSSPDAECAWTERAGFSSSFNGDSTYSWSILADTPTILCVAYTVAAPTIVVEPAIFRLNSVFVRDSAGAIDTLGIGSATATILGNLTVNNVHPTVVPPRPEVVLSVHGSGLVSTSRAFLVTDDVSIPMNEALESSDSVLVASFNVTSSNAQVFDLTIETQDGHSTTYAAAVVVAGPLPPAYPLPVLVDAPAPLPASAIALTRGGLLVSYSDQTGFVYVRTLDDELITLWPVAGLQYVDNLAIDDADRVFVFGGDAPELTIVRVFTLSGGSLASWTAPSGPTAIDYSGNVYIAFGSILRRYSTYGAVLSEFPIYPAADDRFDHLAIDHAQRAHVVDDDILETYDHAGTWIQAEVLLEEFPTYTADRSGNLWIGYPGPNTLEIRSPNLVVLGSWDLPSEWGHPRNVALSDLCDVGVLTSYGYIVRYRHDADGDGLCDPWELDGIGALGNAARFVLPGADPLHKNLYVEVDGMVGETASRVELDKVESAFELVPNELLLPGNPDGAPGISLRCEIDEDNIPTVPWSPPPSNIAGPPEFAAFRGSHFGTPLERTNPGLVLAKALAYRYAVFAHSYSGTSTGRAIDSHSFIVTLGNNTGVTGNHRTGTFMHELGHTLGLRHGGVDDTNYKPNYRSNMNYAYQVPWTGTTAGGQNFVIDWSLGYSNRVFGILNESNLRDAEGIGGDPGRYAIIGPRGPITNRKAKVPEWGPIDWTPNGDFTTTGVHRDINYLDSNDPLGSPGEVLVGVADWPALSFSPSRPAFWQTGNAGPDGMNEVEEGQFDLSEVEMAPGVPLAVSMVSESPVSLEVFPNPIRGAGNFALRAGPGHLRVSVVDVQGRSIRVIADGAVDGAPRVLQWDGRDANGTPVSSGLYFVTAETPNGSLSIRVAVLR